MYENLTPSAFMGLLEMEVTPLRLVILKRDTCPNCINTLAAARTLRLPKVQILSTDIDSFQDILNESSREDVTQMLLDARAQGHKLPLLIRITPNKVASAYSGPMNARDLKTFITTGR